MVKGKSVEWAVSFCSSTSLPHTRGPTHFLSIPIPDSGLLLVLDTGQRLPCQCDQMATSAKASAILRLVENHICQAMT